MNCMLAQTQGGAQPASPASNWYDLVTLKWLDWGVELRIGLLGLLLLGVLIWGLPWLWRHVKRRRMRSWDTTSIKVKYGDLIEQEIKPNHDTVKIAYQAWVEIATRKVGLPFEEDHDLIVEVYNSWYQLFGVLRNLSKSVPAHRLREDKDTQRLVDVLHRVLNEGLRPHLTRWQAKFRRWFEDALTREEDKSIAPQQIQRGFPEYDALVADLRSINQQFVEFAATLRGLAEGPG